jgi:hypothetical protein
MCDLFAADSDGLTGEPIRHAPDIVIGALIAVMRQTLAD